MSSLEWGKTGRAGIDIRYLSMILDAKHDGRECPFQRYDQVVLSSGAKSTDTKEGEILTVTEVVPIEGPVCHWVIRVKGTHAISAFAYQLRLKAKHNDVENWDRNTYLISTTE